MSRDDVEQKVPIEYTVQSKPAKLNTNLKVEIFGWPLKNKYYGWTGLLFLKYVNGGEQTWYSARVEQNIGAQNWGVDWKVGLELSTGRKGPRVGTALWAF